MTHDDRGEIEVRVANDVEADAATGDTDANPLSLTVKLIPIVRLLARQAARDWHQAANDNRDAGEDRLEE
ncbi:MAG: hypothetical protein ACR2RF_28605 [Geminicoccaceae bacterium]